MASERSRSPLELPPRSSGKERHPSRTEAGPDADAQAAPSIPLTSMPISFGVLMLGLTVTCLLCLLLSTVAYRNASAQAQEVSRASERRLGNELSQLRASTVALQAQLELRTQDITEQARDIERLSAELKAVRARSGLDARGARSRR